MNRIFSLLIAFIISSQSFAKDVTVYRWVDENGVIHYTQQHPIEDDYAEIKIDTHYSPIQAPLKNGIKPEKDELADTSTQIVHASVAKCNNAKANLRTLTDFDKIEITDANGKSRILTDKEKLDRIRSVEKDVQDYCY
ncbi:DUF4124 domain-containing protein [Thalassomonas sp. M1454]|uniref:DUF4124 domain-containing protein n=1 Tax=Thalassomonas sp. M1454 TaxID=2594477 RepID=UPI00117F8925|nr:DUF4124 domain-containing protein [Thalassomonas sp. M1454]TRX54406.1 DUF4124 domain-containing protein [Thalassomonas sp. M1454]